MVDENDFDMEELRMLGVHMDGAGEESAIKEGEDDLDENDEDDDDEGEMEDLAFKT